MNVVAIAATGAREPGMDRHVGDVGAVPVVGAVQAAVGGAHPCRARGEGLGGLGSVRARSLERGVLVERPRLQGQVVDGDAADLSGASRVM